MYLVPKLAMGTEGRLTTQQHAKPIFACNISDPITDAPDGSNGITQWFVCVLEMVGDSKPRFDARRRLEILVGILTQLL